MTKGAGSAGSAATASAGSTSQSGASTVGSGGCVSPPGSAPGVTATQMKVSITLVQVVGAAANSSFGIETPSQQQAAYQAVIDSMNAAHGIACRQVVPEFITADPADQSGLEKTCLDIASSGVFAELDFGAYANYPQKDCYAQNHIPYFGAYQTTSGEAAQFYPYIFDLDTIDSLYKDTVFALAARGFFSPTNGFKKLGFIYDSCYPAVISEETNWLQQAGLPSSQISSFDAGCPSTFSSPSTLQQGILQFQRDGVTNVTTAEFVGDFANFTTIAQQQNFHPIYGVPDDSLVNISSGSMHPDYTNIANAITITASRDGENATPGMTPTAGTAACNAIMAAHGLPPVYQQQDGAGGNVCDELWMFKAAVEHAPALAQNALATGLQAAGSVDFSFPEGPNNFAGAGNTVGGQYWRTDQFHSSCTCWQVIDPTFRPNY